MFDHEKPLKITATGHLMPTGVDENASITLLFSKQRIAQINVSTNCNMFAPTFLVGDKGTIQVKFTIDFFRCFLTFKLKIFKIPEFSWCPTKYINQNGEQIVNNLPECEKTNFFNSVGLRFQAEEARLAIQKGLTQHSLVSHDHSRLIMSIMEECIKQLNA